MAFEQRSSLLFRPDYPAVPSKLPPPSFDRVAAAWQLTMELASALQRLSDYSTKNTRASRQIFESGVVIFRNNALHKLGDDSARCCYHSLRTQPHLITPFRYRLAIPRISGVGGY